MIGKWILAAACMYTAVGFAQDVQETFSGTRVINGHSTETLKKRTLQFRIEHRFGDMAGDAGGVQSMFGLDNAADIRFAFEYGISDKWMIGLGRCKGTGAPYSSLIDGFTKYRPLTQSKTMPVSVSVLGAATTTYMKASQDLTLVSSFPESVHRLAYTTQVQIARKFGERVSLLVAPTYVHRNYVANNDVNGTFAMGGAASVRVTKSIGLIGEYYYVMSGTDVRESAGFKNSLSFGFEWITDGHNFKINLTNSKGFTETQFIPYTFSDWSKGEFRLGFSISRDFKL